MPKKTSDLMRRLGIQENELSSALAERENMGGVHMATDVEVANYIAELAGSMSMLARDAGLTEIADDLDNVKRKASAVIKK